MKNFVLIRFILIFFVASFVVGCTDKEEPYVTEEVKDYLPLAVGKYIVYRMDSIRFINFQSTVDTQKYYVKHLIEAKITDNQGRPAYRVYKQIRKITEAESAYLPNGTYSITPLNYQMETNEDNLRILKLHGPLNTGFTWKFNKYLAFSPYTEQGYDFSVDDNMAEWDVVVDKANPILTVRDKTYADVIKVSREEESFGIPITAGTSVASKVVYEEAYQKNVGLVYRHYEMWDYQKNPNSIYTGFGTILWMVDHN